MFQVHRSRAWVVATAISLVFIVAPPAFANGISNEAVLTEGGPVAIDGNTLVSGTSVFTRTGTTWTKQATLPITNPPSEFFAVSSVAIDGDTIVMGVVSTFSFESPQPGFALVFARSGNSWTEQARLTGTDPTVGDDFGGTVDISGDTIVVGATGDSDVAMWAGAAYVFTRTGSTWSRQAKLTPSGAEAGDFFGRVALDGDTLIAGATGAGAAYVFTRTAGSWTQQAALAPSPASSLFGWSVDIDGDTAVVAALRDSAVQPSAGAVFVFTRSGTTWTQTAKLTASDSAADLLFGTDVAVDGKYLVASRSGFTDEAGPRPGAVYVFENRSTGWTETNKLTSAAPTAMDNFGVSVDLDAGTIPVAAPASAAPATYVFHLGMQRSGEGIGLVDPVTGLWYLLDPDGKADPFYFGNPGDVPFMGDWNCDGIDTPGLYRSDGFAYLRNSSNTGPADIKFFFGNPSDVPVAGDFNGNGCDTVSIYRPAEQRFYITNTLGPNNGVLPQADLSYVFGNPGDKPFVGDFDGDSIETAGLHRESTGFVYFRNTHTQGNADAQFFFGDPGDRMIAGDWTQDRTDTPALYRPSDITFYFRNSNTQGFADDQVTWGRDIWLPVHGRFGLFTKAPAEPGRPSVQDAAAFAKVFLDARLAGSDAEAFLTPIAAGQYADPGNGLALYSGYTAAGVVTIGQADPSSFEVGVQLFGTSGTVEEVLFVGSGEDVGGVPRDLIVRGANLFP